MSLLAADRLTLLVSLVPYLAAHPDGVPVAQAAAHFEVPVEEIRQVVQLIAVSGTPGETGTYQELDLFDIDWDALELHDEIRITRFIALQEAPALSALESSTLLAGLQYLHRLVDPPTAARLQALIGKLAAHSRAAAAPAIAIAPAAPDGRLRLLRQALDARRRVTFEYRSPRSGVTRRRVDPLRLDAVDDDWYLRAWCLDRRAERSFLVDRMLQLQLLDEAAQEHPGRAAAAALFHPSADDPNITLRVNADALAAIRDFLPLEAQLPKPGEDGAVVLEVPAASWHPFLRLVASNAGRIRILAPAEARHAAAAWALAALDAQSDNER